MGDCHDFLHPHHDAPFTLRLFLLDLPAEDRETDDVQQKHATLSSQVSLEFRVYCLATMF